MNQQISISLPTDVVQAAMQALAQKDDDYEERIASIRARVKASIEDPRPALTGEQVKARLDAFFESRQ